MAADGANAAGLVRFVVLATPRSGSNWLCTLLDSHPEVLCHHELFNPDGVHLARSLRGTDFALGPPGLAKESPLEFVQATWQRSLGHSCVGFKLNVGQSKDVFSAVLDDCATKKVIVTRKNRIRAYVSERIAEASGQWESYPESSPPRRVEAVHVEPTALKQHARRNSEYLADISRRLRETDQQPFPVFYENIGHGQTQRELLRFLGVDPEADLRGSTSRMNPQPLPSLIENFNELREALSGDELLNDLVEEMDKA